MLCPLKFSGSLDYFCDRENCGFYSCKSQKCAVASLGDIAREIDELIPSSLKTSDAQREAIKRYCGLRYGRKTE